MNDIPHQVTANKTGTNGAPTNEIHCEYRCYQADEITAKHHLEEGHL